MTLPAAVRAWACLALAAVACAGFGLAQDEAVGTAVEARPGSVVTVRADLPSDPLPTVDADARLLPLGVTSPRDGRVVASLLVRPGALAGDAPVSFLGEDGAVLAERTVAIALAPDLRLEADAPAFVRAGESAEGTLRIRNAGNADDVVRLSVRSGDDLELERTTFTLEAGETVAVPFVLSARGFGPRNARIEAVSSLSADANDVVLLRYDALALGSDDPDAPILQYAVPLGIGVGSSGFEWSAGLSLDGALSDLVRTSESVDFRPEGTSVAVGLLGDDWSATYGLDPAGVHDASVGVGPVSVQGSFALDRAPVTTVSVTPGALGVRYTRDWGERGRDDLTLRYAFQPDDGVQVTTGVGLRGEPDDYGSYRVRPLFDASLAFSTPDLTANVRGSVAPGTRAPWNASLSAATRQVEPVSFRASLSLSPSGWSAVLASTQRVSDDVRLQQTVRTRDGTRFEARAVGRYAPEGSPFAATLTLTGSVADGTVRGGAALAATYATLPWSHAARITVGPSVTAAYGIGYAGPGYSVGGSLRVPVTDGWLPTLGVNGAVRVPGDVTLGGSFRLDTRDGGWGASASASVPVTPDASLQGSLGTGSDGAWSWSLGAQATLAGGFAVPDGIVSLFGGREIATVEGRVLLRDPSGDLVPYEGAVIEATGEGDTAATETDEDGTFRISLAPGEVVLAVRGTPPDLRVVQGTDEPLSVARGGTAQRDLILEPSYAVTGQVVFDPSRSGTPGPDASGVANVSVRLEPIEVDTVADDAEPASDAESTVEVPADPDPDTDAGAAPAADAPADPSAVRTATTGRGGSFAFRDLAPGRYRVVLGGSGVPSGSDVLVGEREVELDPDANRTAFVTLVVSPVERRVVTTFGDGRLSLSADLDDSSVPAGGLADVTADAPNALRVTATAGDVTVDLVRGEDGRTFRGSVPIPPGAIGVALIDVVAEGEDDTATRTLMPMVTDGPLGRLEFRPSLPDPGGAVEAVANLRIEADSVQIRFDDRTVDLDRTSGRRWAASFTAPDRAEDVTFVLLADGEPIDERVLRIR